MAHSAKKAPDPWFKEWDLKLTIGDDRIMMYILRHNKTLKYTNNKSNPLTLSKIQSYWNYDCDTP